MQSDRWTAFQLYIFVSAQKALVGLQGLQTSAGSVTSKASPNAKPNAMWSYTNTCYIKSNKMNR